MTGSWHFRAAATAFLCCLVLGGGTRPGFLTDFVLQIACVPVLCWSLWRLPGVALARWGWTAIGIGAVAVALPLVQVVPLPMRVWQSFPVRGAEVAVLDLVGSPPSALPISVSTQATLLGALSLIPPATILLSVLQMRAQERRTMTLLFVAFGVASAFLGLAQLSQGPNSPLRTFEFTNQQDAVGMFANRNHFATLINCAIVFAIGWTLHVGSARGDPGGEGSRGVLFLTLGLTAIFVLVAGAAMARSRAGIVGTAVALVAGLALALRSGDANSRVTFKPVRALVAAVAFSVLLALQFALYRLVDRFAVDPLKDARGDFARVTLEAVKAYFPFGSGIGTFTRVYPTFEKPHQALLDTYVNRAHNDFLEFALETGLFGAGLVAAIGILVCVFGWRAWTRRDLGARQLDATLMRAASVVLVLIALHSALDYPLRTSAMMAVASLALGLIFEAPRAQASSGAGRANVSSPPREAAPVSAIFSAPTPAAIGARKLWGEDVEWPEEWRNPEVPKRNS